MSKLINKLEKDALDMVVGGLTSTPEDHHPGCKGVLNAASRGKGKKKGLAAVIAKFGCGRPGGNDQS